MAHEGTDSSSAPGLVYLIRNGDGEIIYIGQTVDLHRRMTDHRKKSPFRHAIASVETLPLTDLSRMEASHWGDRVLGDAG